MNTQDGNTDGASIGTDARVGTHICAIETLNVKWVGIGGVLNYHLKQLQELSPNLGEHDLEEIAGALRIIGFGFFRRTDMVSQHVAADVDEAAVTFWQAFVRAYESRVPQHVRAFREVQMSTLQQPASARS